MINKHLNNAAIVTMLFWLFTGIGIAGAIKTYPDIRSYIITFFSGVAFTGAAVSTLVILVEWRMGEQW